VNRAFHECERPTFFRTWLPSWWLRSTQEDGIVEITEVRIKLMSDNAERLLAFCSMTIDGCFVVRDLKIIRGIKGPFVAMPSRKLTDHCHRCHGKNALRSNYCAQCGQRLRDERAPKGLDGRAKLYADIAHPINSECRDLIQNRVLDEYDLELERSKLPGYICRYDDYDAGEYDLDEAQRWDAIHARRIDSPTASAIPGPHELERLQRADRSPDEWYGNKG
jgi:stage V sporulation protein G